MLKSWSSTKHVQS